MRINQVFSPSLLVALLLQSVPYLVYHESGLCYDWENPRKDFKWHRHLFSYLCKYFCIKHSRINWNQQSFHDNQLVQAHCHYIITHYFVPQEVQGGCQATISNLTSHSLQGTAFSGKKSTDRNRNIAILTLAFLVVSIAGDSCWWVKEESLKNLWPVSKQMLTLTLDM